VRQYKSLIKRQVFEPMRVGRLQRLATADGRAATARRTQFGGRALYRPYALGAELPLPVVALGR
jgi:hypothetical protein